MDGAVCVARVSDAGVITSIVVELSDVTQRLLVTTTDTLFAAGRGCELSVGSVVASTATGVHAGGPAAEARRPAPFARPWRSAIAPDDAQQAPSGGAQGKRPRSTPPQVRITDSGWHGEPRSEPSCRTTMCFSVCTATSGGVPLRMLLGIDRHRQGPRCACARGGAASNGGAAYCRSTFSFSPAAGLPPNLVFTRLSAVATPPPPGVSQYSAESASTFSSTM